MNFDFRGAQVDRSAFGEHAFVDARGSSGAATTLGAELDGLRRQLQEQPAGADRDAALDELDGLRHEVARTEPDRDEVRTRWQRVQARVLPALGATADLGGIGSLILELVGA